MKKKIAHVCVSKGFGGLELYSLQLHQKFQQHGFEGLHYTLIGSPLDKKVKDLGLPLVSMSKSGYVSWSRIKLFRESIKAQGIHQVIVHHLKDLWFVTPALRGMPEVEVIGVSHMFLQNINKKDLIHSYLYGRLKKLVALTEIQKAGLLKCLPVKEEQVAIIPNGIDLRRFQNLSTERRQELRRSISVAPDELLIGMVGRIDPYKGQKELLEAFSKLAKKHAHIRLCLIGDLVEEKHAEYSKRLKGMLSELGLEDRVTVLGFQENVPEWMHAFDVFVMPSYEETFGIVLIEAMAAGTPCVSTRAGGVPEIITSEELGLLVPPRSAEGLVHALKRLIQEPELRERLGRTGRKKAFGRYDQEKLFAEIRDLFDGISKDS